MPPHSVRLSSLADLRRVLRQSPGFDEVVAALKRGQAGTFDGAWGSSAALAAAALAEVTSFPTLIVIAHPGDIDTWTDDLASFTGARPTLVPDQEDDPGLRLKVIKTLLGSPSLPASLPPGERGAPPPLLLTTMRAMMQPVPSPVALAQQSRELIKDDEVRLDELAAWLVQGGYTRTEVVELPGEFSRRGGILDIYPADADHPVRVEFFGDVIDSIRRFVPETQRSREEIEHLSITALRQEGVTDNAPFMTYLPNEAWSILVEPSELREQGKVFLERMEDHRGLFGLDATFRHLTSRPSVHITALPTVSAEATCHLRIESVERFSGDPLKVAGELESLTGQIVVACTSKGEQDRLAELLSSPTPSEGEGRGGTSPSPLAGEGRGGGAPGLSPLADSAQGQVSTPPLPNPPLPGGRGQESLGRGHPHIVLLPGHVATGFRLVLHDLAVVGVQELFRREAMPTHRRFAVRRYETRAIESFLDLAEGDLVVHVNHGIARYRGLQVLNTKGQLSEHMLLEFAAGTKLYVPTDKVDLVQKYVGGGHAEPELSKLGGVSWQRRKEKVREAVLDLAAQMVDLQAQRETQPGFAYPADSPWMHEFESSFPYEETPDQGKAIVDVKSDLEHPRPMDRLLCGDVGYGKTEVALRAAFKAAADGGKQVAVLVPTTVLAEQHFRTFSGRLAPFPFKVACLSRFRRPGEQKEIVKQIKDGAIDIVIGTHRLLSKDVTFKDLGLVVIDEEQRFGVEHKEKLKHLRAQVHVLTMTATPIPRTLHMSLLGIRDISNLETPPLGRMPIETRIARFDPEMIKHAIQRELAREGQIYFVHNKVFDIEAVRHRLHQIVPGARILIGHGQMPERELEDVMVKFVKHQADILLSTTIIESGLDIPNANTIFIDEADNYGLADLHQLRGRVGRYKHRAYCYLLIDPSKKLTDVAAKRLKAIEEFRELGAGFKIALRDLEIRGAGNILGAEQSGHIAAVGYELYCQLLEEAVRRAKKQPVRQTLDVTVELPWPAFLPATYVEGQKAKIEVYRRLGRLRTLDRLSDFRDELADRYGPIPEPVENLIKMHELRLLAAKWQISLIRREGKDLVLEYRHRAKIDKLAATSGPVPNEPGQPAMAGHRLKVVDDQTAYFRLRSTHERTAGGMYERLKSLLEPNEK
jgi:transcription-repair coupling factor (superfamily II helicase)